MTAAKIKEQLQKQYPYRIEMHAHTSPCSPCGTVAPDELVNIYLKLGYDAVVITNHFSSGYGIFDVHTYIQDVEEFKRIFSDFENGEELKVQCRERQTHKGEPVFISEYGGIKWTDEESAGWGYGDAPKTKEEFLSRLKGLTDVILDSNKIFGFCYTQLYDVEQEVNGLYTYERKPKFDSADLYRIFRRKAKIEAEPNPKK